MAWPSCFFIPSPGLDYGPKHNHMASDLSIPLFFSTSFFFFFLLLLHLVSTVPDPCSARSCKPGEPEIRYPFRLQPDECCVCPGFDLSCNSQNRTTLRLPLSGEFIVESIDYFGRVIEIGDPAKCLPKRLHDFTTSASVWKVIHRTNLSFFKCPAESMALDVFMRVPCLDGHNYSVVNDETWTSLVYMIEELKRFHCNYSQTIAIPTVENWSNFYDLLFLSSIFLTWDDPSDCTGCEAPEGTITPPPPSPEGLKNDTTYRWIILVLSVTGLMFVVSSIAFTLRFRRLTQHDHTNPSSPRPDRALALVDRSGMDTPIIESYPKTRVGDAGGLMPQDNSCSICLSEYKSKEVLRTLPECEHSFHAHCIDPWLKRNACCPLCRNDQGYAKSIVSTQEEEEEEEDLPYADFTIGN